MRIQEDIIIFLSILVGFLVFGLLILKKSLYNHNVRLQEELNDFKIETKKEFERVRFTEKPICKVGDVYNKRYVVTKAKYKETNSHVSWSILDIVYEYELLDLEIKKPIIFRSNSYMEKFIKDNNLTLDETKN